MCQPSQGIGRLEVISKLKPKNSKELINWSKGAWAGLYSRRKQHVLSTHV